MSRADLSWFAHESVTARMLRHAVHRAATRARSTASAIGVFVDDRDPTAGFALACAMVAGCYASAMVLSGAW